MKSEDEMAIIGFLDPINDGRVRGWAKNNANDDPVRAILLVNNNECDTCECNIFREDVLSAGHGTGYCGFEFGIDQYELTDVSRFQVVVINRQNVCYSANQSYRSNSTSIFEYIQNTDRLYNDPSQEQKQPKPAQITGYVDHIDHKRVSGWALQNSDPDIAVQLEVLVDDRVIGEIASNLKREDLKIAGIGSGMHGFQFMFPPGTFAGRPHQVSVRDKQSKTHLQYAEGIDSKITADTRTEGAVDVIDGDHVSGWVLDHLAKDKPVEIGVYLGSNLIGRGRTDKFRKDVFASKGGHGFYGFRIRLKQKVYRDDFSSLKVLAIVYGSPIFIKSSLAQSLPNKPVSQKRGYKGYLDKSDRETIAGWAVDESNPEVATTVDIYVNGALIRSTIAGLTRKDLVSLYPTSEGKLGFNYQLPYGHSLRGTAPVSAKFTQNGQRLTNSPKQGMLGRKGSYLNSRTIQLYRDRIRREQVFTPKAVLEHTPKVSAIILNRNGEDFLNELFVSVDRYNTYPNIEFIVVDHGSTDKSKAICKKWSENLQIRFLNRGRNFSYSASNNFGVANSDSDILFFLNNDIRFCSDFVHRAVSQLDDDIGIVGFKLATPPEQIRLESGASRADLMDVGIVMDQIQHLGVRMTTAAGDRSFLPFEEPLTRDNEDMSFQPLIVPCVTAAALLVNRSDFLSVGGFHEEYFYGFEDVDFCLTFRELTGKRILCLNDTKLFHFRSASLQRSSENDRKAKAKNKDIISGRLGNFITNELRQERCNNDSFLRDSTVRIAFLVSEVSDNTSAGDYFTALEMAKELSEGHKFECVFLATNEWYDLVDFDVAIAMVDGFKPTAITSCRSDIILIAWIRNWFDKWLSFAELEMFDSIWVSSLKALAAFQAKVFQKVELVRIATNVEYFQGGIRTDELSSDYCFTGSYFGSWRDIIGSIAPASLSYTFALYGHGWNQVEWLAPYYRGPLSYSRMRDVYASTRVVIDDANHTTFAWGSVNSRVFDALASGALVITNSRSASDDAFDGLLPVFHSPAELKRLLEYYLGNEEARLDLVNRLRSMIENSHSYSHRAQVAAADIKRLFGMNRIGLKWDGNARLAEITNTLRHGIWESNNIGQFVRDGSRLTIARNFGLDIDIRISGLLDPSVPGDLLKSRFNVLIALFERDRVSLSQAKALSSTFDLIITIEEEMATLLSSQGEIDVYCLSEFGKTKPTSDFEKMRWMEDLFDARRIDLFSYVMRAYETWSSQSRIVKPGYGPSLAHHDATNVAKELRIGYVLWDFPSLSQTFVINELRRLVEMGYDVRVYYKVFADKPAALDFEVASYIISDADELVSLLKEHARTIIHSPFAYPATAHLTFPAAQATGIPFTIMPAGVDISHYDNMQRNRIAEITRSPLCLGVITIGNYHHKFLVEQGVPERKIILERQAVDPPISTEINRKKPHSAGRRPRVIAIGRFVEKKGFRYLAEAASMLHDFDIIFYGYGPLEDELRSIVNRDGVNNVHFGGSLDDKQALWNAYAEADIFCLPCVRAADGDLDGLPTVILEAMSAGVPVVSTRVANIPDVVIDGITGFLAEPRNAGELAKSIRTAASMDSGQLQRIVNAARVKVQNYASVNDTVSTLTRLWQNKVIDIVLVTYDRGKYKNITDTINIIDRVYQFTSLPFNLIVVDNGSDDSFRKEINDRYSEHENFQLIELGENTWCGPATNVGIDAGSGDFIIYLCSKEAYVLRRGWERDFIKYMEKNAEVGIAGHLVTLPRYFDSESYQQYPKFGSFRNQDFARANAGRHFSHVQGGIYILRRAAYDAVGGFSTDVPQDGTDVEYSYYLESKGWKLGDIPNVYSGTVLTQPSVLSMVDENVSVVHPLNSNNVKKFDMIASCSVHACNICGWQGERFIAEGVSDDSLCPQCGSDSFARSVIRLLSLTDNLQRKPRTWFISNNASLVPILRQLSVDFIWEKDLRPLSDPTSPRAFDLVVIDHISWTNAELVSFETWVDVHLSHGRSLVVGEGLDLDPIASTLSKYRGNPVLYDSEVLGFDRKNIMAYNVHVHP